MPFDDAELYLDSDPEQFFETIVGIVCSTLAVPVCLVTIVLPDRQVFRAARGLSEPWRTQRQTPLSHSFCQHVVATEQRMVIVDSAEDPLLHDNPAVAELGVVAYLGVPIHDRDGRVIGALCAIDHKPRAWTEQDERLMHMVSWLVDRGLAEPGEPRI